jgi:ComF family protein
MFHMLYLSNGETSWRLHALRMAKALGRTALDFVYPPICLACRAAVAETGALCASCWGEMRFIERPFCERLGTPFEQDLGPGLISPQAIADPPVYGRARAAVRFEDGPARRLIHRLKYSDRIEMAKPIGRWMARAGADILAEADVLAPVPLHRRRLMARRFNQAAALAAVIGAAAAKPCDLTLLIRVKATKAQVGLSRAQRADNVQGAFRTPAKAEARLIGRRVVLVDDVLTSSATVNAAARALLRAGAANVDVLVFARVVTDA